MNWPSGAVIALDGENIDGQNNALVETGNDAYSWVNSGSFATKFTRVGVASTPLVKKLAGSSVVSFDGRSDLLSCAGSAAALAFIHTTGVFDMAITLRRMATRGGAVRMFGTEDKGLGMYSTGYVAGTSIEGGYNFFLSNGTGEISTLVTQEIAAPLGVVSSLFVRGDGTKLECTQDFWDWEQQTFLAALGTGNASNDYAIGSTGGATASIADNFFCMDLFDLRIWSRNLTDAELDVVQANFATRSAAS